MVGRATIRMAFLTKDRNMRMAELCLRTRECSACMRKAMHNLVHIYSMFPNEASDSWVGWQGFSIAIGIFIPCCRAFDGEIVDEYVGNMGDLIL